MGTAAYRRRIDCLEDTADWLKNFVRSSKGKSIENYIAVPTVQRLPCLSCSSISS